MLSARVGVLEIAADEVRLAVVKTGGKLPKMLEGHRAPIRYAAADEREEAIAAAISDVVSRVKTNPAVYAWCAPSTYSIARQLTVPFKGARRVAAAVQYELEPYLAFPIDDLVVKHLNVREVEGETQVLCLGIRRDYLEEHLALLEAGGVQIEGIILDALALTHLWDLHAGLNSGLNAVLHVRADHSVLSIKADKQIAYLRHMSAPAARYHENPQAAAREVQKLLRAFTSSWSADAEVTSLTVTGLRLFDDERALFEDALQVPLQFLDLVADLVELEEADVETAPSSEILIESVEHRWAACIGAAAGAAGAPHALDFQSDDLGAAPARGGLVRHVVFSAVLALIALGGYVAYAYIDYRGNQAEVERLGAEVYEEFRLAYPNSDAAKERPANDIGGLLSFQLMQEEAEAESQATTALRVELFSRPTLLDVLRELALHVPDAKVGINELELTSAADGLNVKMEGEVKDTSGFTAVVSDLDASDALQVDPNVNRSSERGQEIFTLRATDQE